MARKPSEFGRLLHERTPRLSPVEREQMVIGILRKPELMRLARQTAVISAISSECPYVPFLFEGAQEVLSSKTAQAGSRKFFYQLAVWLCGRHRHWDSSINFGVIRDLTAGMGID